MRGPLQRIRALPLRSRLALLVATAVAVAVAAAAASCWFVTRAQLEHQLDTTLRSTTADERYLSSLYAYCLGTGQQLPRTDSGLTVQLIDAQGTVCIDPDTPALPVTRSDLAVVNREQPTTLHTATDADGVRMRVFTKSAEVKRGLGQPPLEIAFSVARPLSEVDKPLTTLAWVLLLVSGIGVIGAGAAGLWVARSGLRPVDELTEAVEHVARTEDLTVRIPVEGEDEIARLSRSFNSMTASLATSRDRQAQLIADAGHELRTPSPRSAPTWNSSPAATRPAGPSRPTTARR